MITQVNERDQWPHGRSLTFVRDDNVKVSTEIAAETSGVLDAMVPEGQEVKIGEVVATIDDSKKPADAAPADKKKEKAETKAAAPPKEKPADAKTLSPAVRRIVDEEHLEPEKISG